MYQSINGQQEKPYLCHSIVSSPGYLDTPLCGHRIPLVFVKLMESQAGHE